MHTRTFVGFSALLIVRIPVLIPFIFTHLHTSRTRGFALACDCARTQQRFIPRWCSLLLRSADVTTPLIRD
eukprot:6186950-Pleurochrysis_carterae.AAC.1